MFGVCDTIIYEHIVRLNGMVVCNYIFFILLDKYSGFLLICFLHANYHFIF